nr:hypothetical protein [uncultured Desulfuromonas sp.]
MSFVLRTVLVALVITSVSACTTYTGDSLLQLTEQPVTYEQQRTIAKAQQGVADILDRMKIPQERKAVFETISPVGVIRDNEPLTLSRVQNQLVIAGQNVTIAHAINSIIISSGALHISHGGNNAIVCGGDVDISHDGSMGNGSLVISKGKTKISHAGNSLIYAIGGVEISHARNVHAFNTRERKTSWGHINNILIKPLFREETEFSQIENGE